MREDICTIPVNEVFEHKDGCPICRMKNLVEERLLDYIMGAAMMEPDVRIETNRLGFCGDHLKKMAARRGRLSLALMLDSHTDEVLSKVFSGGLLGGDKGGKKSGEILNSCFLCEKIEWGLSRMIATVYRSFETDREFRQLFEQQPMFCLPHYHRLIAGADKKQMKKYGSEFSKAMTDITSAYLKTLSGDVKHYTKMYDYQNSGEDADWGNSRDSIERAIAFLSGEH